MAFDGKAEAAQFCFDKLKVWNMSWFLGSKLCQCVTFNEVLEFSFTKYWECKVFSTVALCKNTFCLYQGCSNRLHYGQCVVKMLSCRKILGNYQKFDCVFWFFPQPSWRCKLTLQVKLMLETSALSNQLIKPYWFFSSPPTQHQSFHRKKQL